MDSLEKGVKLDFLTPSKRGFQPRAMSYLCHWLVDSTPQALSEARRLLLLKADTDLVLFVDDDIEFGLEHVKILLDKMSPTIVAVESNPQIPGFPIQRSERITRGWTGLTLHAVTAPGGRLSARVRAFRDYVSENLAT